MKSNLNENGARFPSREKRVFFDKFGVAHIATKEFLDTPGFASERDVQKFFSENHLMNIVSNIVSFENRMLENPNFDEIKKLLVNIFLLQDGEMKVSFLDPEITKLQGPKSFFRIRKLIDNDFEKTYKTKSDLWAPPAKFVNNRGRLNKLNESFLYVAESKEVAVKETHIQNYEEFMLIEYTNNCDIYFKEIGFWRFNEDRSNIRNVIFSRMHDFLFKLFSKKVTNDTEIINYIVSDYIAKFYFRLAGEHGWIYPSVAAEEGVNFAFNPDIGKEVLTPERVGHCVLVDDVVYVSTLHNL